MRKAVRSCRPARSASEPLTHVLCHHGALLSSLFPPQDFSSFRESNSSPESRTGNVRDSNWVLRTRRAEIPHEPKSLVSRESICINIFLFFPGGGGSVGSCQGASCEGDEQVSRSLPHLVLALIEISHSVYIHISIGS